MAFGALVGATMAPFAAANGSVVTTLPVATQAGEVFTGPDGAIWFDGRYGYESHGEASSFIGRLGADGSVEEFPLPLGRSANSPVSGPGGDIWFADNGGQEGDHGFRIGRLTTSGQMSEYLLGPQRAEIGAIAASDDELWVSAFFRNANGEATRSVLDRVVTVPEVSVQQEFAFRPYCGVSAIAARGGAVWFAELCEPRDPEHAHWRAHIVKISAAGEIARYELPPFSYVQSLDVAPSGTLWFGSFGSNGDRIEFGRITRGKLKSYLVPDGDPSTIAVGRGGHLWFPSSFGGEVYRALNSIDSKGQIAKPICAGPSCELAPIGLTTGPDGNLWFSAGLARGPNRGGGGAGLIEAMEIEQLPGMIATLSLRDASRR